MSNRLLYFLLILLGIGLLVLLLRHDQGSIAGLDIGDLASLVVKIALLVFIGGAVLGGVAAFFGWKPSSRTKRDE